MRGRGLTSGGCRVKSKRVAGKGSEMENVMRSSTVGGSREQAGDLGPAISISEGIRWSSSKGAWLVLGGTRGGTSRQRPRATEARRDPPPSRARWVVLSGPVLPRNPRSGWGEPAGEPPSSLPESP